MIKFTQQGQSLELSSPVAMPLASAFLWNPQMMIQVNCRGYATAQFMQPEPAKYAYAPNLEAKTFMQPEQPYYAHHPGRFFYIKDCASGVIFSAPFEPVRGELDEFAFIAGQHSIEWRVRKQVTVDRPAELWQTKITNLGDSSRKLSVTPYFPVGYMSWMNQSGAYNPELQAVVCRSITPYQKYSDYFKNKDFKDLTYFLADTKPDSWEARQSAFEGDGGLHAPSALQNDSLSNSDAIYETPAAVLQYPLELAANENRSFKFVFGAAADEREIAEVKRTLFADQEAFNSVIQDYAAYIAQGKGPLKISTPDAEFDNFVNNWLPRQVYYHGDVNRLSTDPQTRNYLQDNMGMSYIKPEVARKAFLHALSQQNINGAMPDGILVNENAELKYINQVPHMDHCVWLPIALSAYLDETGDYQILQQGIPYADSATHATVSEHVDLAMNWLFAQRDHRGLSFIQQGDWCDPMNMVGYKGRGVSAWLTLAAAYAFKLWANVCQGADRSDQATQFRTQADLCNAAVNEHLWDQHWYARGITDDGALFGTYKDPEGRIFLNPQSWAILSGAADSQRQATSIDAVEQHLQTPFGVEMLSPAFTEMRDDIGRITQKHPGSAENGSVYNHAAAFYSYALYQINDRDRAFQVLRQMIPGPGQADLVQRGQIPVFIPNYYRGAHKQFPRTAGRSSQLFNTGTVHWFYRCLIDGLFGVQGTKRGLRIEPQLPSDWPSAKLTRQFRGAEFNITINRNSQHSKTTVTVDGEQLEGTVIEDITHAATYQVNVDIPQ